MQEIEHYKVKLRKNTEITSWETYLQGKNISFEKKEYFPEYEIYKIPAPSTEILEEIQHRKEVFFIEKMHRYFLDFQTKKIEQQEIRQENPKEGQEYPVIGIVDNGIAKIKEFKSWLYEDEYSYCSEEVKATHGSFVAGTILYGDELAKESWVAGQKVKIYDGLVVPNFSVKQLEEDELLLRIRKVIEEHSWIKVWNIAISIRFPVNLHRISEFGLLLDYLQETYDILICKSCGNGDFTKTDSTRNNILQGSDTVRSLVVASCNHEKKVSRFSLGGEGHSILVKPDIAMYGGDIRIDENGKRKVEKVISYAPSGENAISFGTSFATARMSALVANILFWKKDASPLFLKAMVTQTSSGSEIYRLGYGCPKNSQEIHEEYQNSIVIEGVLETEKKILLSYSDFKIVCTLACDVGLDYHQEEEYILSDVGIRFQQNGIPLERKNVCKVEEKLNSLKKYEFDLEDEKGEIEVIFYQRETKRNNTETKKKRGHRYCCIWKK